MLINFFYSICFLIWLSAFYLIISKNPVHSVLLLVMIFIETSILFFMLGAEFIAILLITVYVGAIAILFLFVVMLLNLRIVELYSSMQYHIPIGSFIGILFIFFLFNICNKELGMLFIINIFFFNIFSFLMEYIFFENNLHSLGEVFYNYYLDIFFFITLILLVAMIGVILLAVNLDYREAKMEMDLIFNESFRKSLANVLWFNMEIYGKKRQGVDLNLWRVKIRKLKQK